MEINNQQEEKAEPANQDHKNSVNIFLIVLLLISISANIVFILKCQSKSTIYELKPSPTLVTDQNVTPSITPSSAVMGKFAQLLANRCGKGSIDLKSLPFDISKSFLEKYSYKDVACNDIPQAMPNEQFLTLSSDASNGQDSLIPDIYIFHSGSLFRGMGDLFGESESLTPTTIDSSTYMLDFVEPGPYGISSYGISIVLSRKIRFENDDITVRSVSGHTFKDDEALAYVEKYGSKLEFSGGPSIVLDSDKEDMFKQDFIKWLLTKGTKGNIVLLQQAKFIDESLSAFTLK